MIEPSRCFERPPQDQRQVNDGAEFLRAGRAWQAAQHAGADQDMFVDSAALNLHGFYAGVERLFEAVALQLDGSLPKGEAWHHDLLDQMALNLPGLRPAIVSAALVQSLDEYRRFRHVVRNVYARDSIHCGWVSWWRNSRQYGRSCRMNS